MVTRYAKEEVVSTRVEFERKLRIDEDDLDVCLVEQPDLFYHVARALAEANAKRDTAKLLLEDTIAELDREVRKSYARSEEKVTEAGIQNQLRTIPKIKTLRLQLVEANAEVERWTALKESYSQRSFMLRELNSSQIARMHNLSLERGAVGARHRLGDAARAAGEEARRERRLSRS